MTKQILGETVRITKNGQINKTDLSKVSTAYYNAYAAAERGWEFIAMMDGQNSPRALELNAKVEYFHAMWQQTYRELRQPNKQAA